jgi:nucleoside-diphosphate-sugar epimerase
MKRIVIFGGAGFIGTFVARRWLETGQADEVILADIRPSPLAGQPGIKFAQIDVRQPIPADLAGGPVDWIFNFAAVHREPGHEAHEYFDTNIMGASNVCNYAQAIACQNIYFTSSISVYGPTKGPTDEDAPIVPISPYGGSKFPAELIHKIWQAGDAARRLIIVRPGVVYGPADPGNIGRMIKAIQKGYFVFPGSTNIYKSYAYIYGLLDSIDFVIASGRQFVCYNYVETPTQQLGEIADEVKKFCGIKARTISLPTGLLVPAATAVQLLLGSRNPIHPVRVRKAGNSTHIIPGTLQKMGFDFKYTFANSLKHWAERNPQDFA